MLMQVFNFIFLITLVILNAFHFSCTKIDNLALKNGFEYIYYVPPILIYHSLCHLILVQTTAMFHILPDLLGSYIVLQIFRG